MSQKDVARMRSVLACAILLVVAACGPDGRQPASSAPSKTETPAQSASPRTYQGTWTRIPKAPFGWYRPEGTFWIDDRLIVVSGHTIQSWDPADSTWTTIVTIPQSEECEGCGYSETVVWTGDELLLWGGGFSYLSPDGSAHSFVAVDPAGNITPLPEAPIPVRWWHSAIWTGDEMIVFGGGHDYVARRDGAAFDPESNTWRELPRSPVGGYANTLVWTGEEMITWGGILDSTTGTHGYPTGFIADGAAYDPKADSWRVLPNSGLDPRGWHSTVWTGDEMIVWGGVSEPQTNCYDCGYPDDAGAYDPVTGTWREVAPGPLSGRVEHTAVWTGSEMIVFGGSPPGGGLAKGDGALYDIDEGTWSLLPDAPTGARYRHAALWNGEEMVVWGGFDEAAHSDGASFRPDP